MLLVRIIGILEYVGLDAEGNLHIMVNSRRKDYLQAAVSILRMYIGKRLEINVSRRLSQNEQLLRKG